MNQSSVILRPRSLPLPLVIGCLLGQFLIVCAWIVTTLENQVLVNRILSDTTWRGFVSFLGAQILPLPDGPQVTLPLTGPVLLAVFPLAISLWLAPCLRRLGPDWTTSEWIGRNALLQSLFAIPLLVVQLLWGLGWGLEHAALNWSLAFSVMLAGWIWTAIPLPRPRTQSLTVVDADRFPFWLVLGGVLASTLIFTAMNWGLWFSLRLPHGDSAMYEEHLWNLLHGKGFRSYLDQGLFLGEHIQVIHILLIPVYLLWPSHITLELCESLALASTAIPVYFIARRHLQSPRAAAGIAIASLFYFPLHYIDIAIDLKTFRPNAFGIPALMWGIEFLERQRWKSLGLCLVLALASQEDYAVVIAPWGLWMAWDALRSGQKTPATKTQLSLGLAICLLVTLYLGFVVKYAIPWFRAGETVHYARYFADFGEGPVEIVLNILLKPGLLLVKLAAPFSIALGLQLLVPMPGWRGGSSWLITAPLFVLLCLNEVQQSTAGHIRPVHHFHAAMIPFIFWAACLCPWRPVVSTIEEKKTNLADDAPARLWGRLVFSLSLTTCLFFSMSPMGIGFWDQGSPFYWKRLYLPDQRAREFAKIPPLIPSSARVASTDFVHPRFTHYERSYDYSDYPRKVSDYLPKVPDDTDYIVLDLTHPYSRVRRLEDVRELIESPEQWELVPIDTKGLFVVLKRTHYAPHPEESGSP